MARDPHWTWEETVLALDFYARHHPQPPSKDSAEVVELSELLNSMAAARGVQRSAKFRNPNGVHMKLMNFRRHDPEFSDSGRSGLARGAKIDGDVFSRYWTDQNALRQAAAEIRSAAHLVATDAPSIDEEIEAAEGALVMVLHRRRERNKSLAIQKRNSVLRATGKLACEVCDFDFAAAYGQQGFGFIEVHHNVPLGTLTTERKTTLSDLACVCANCHRMLHRNGILTVDELRQRLI